MINRITVPAPATCRHLLVLSLLALLGSDVVAKTSGSIAARWGGVNPALTTTLTLDRGLLVHDSIRAERNGGIRYYNTAGGWTKNNNLSGVPTNTSGAVTGDAFGYAGALTLIIASRVE